MTYKDELVRSMDWLAKKKDTIFLGQSVKYSGNAIFNTLKTVPKYKKLETPIDRDANGYFYWFSFGGLRSNYYLPRFDFLLLACNQLVNHLDKINYMSNGKMIPKVIIRTSNRSEKALGWWYTTLHKIILKLLIIIIRH